MEPADFKTKWGLTTGDLAKLLGSNPDHVKRWLFKSNSKNHRKPPEGLGNRLDEIDYMWERLAGYPDHIVEKYAQFILNKE